MTWQEVRPKKKKYMSKSKAFDYQTKLNIQGLADVLVSNDLVLLYEQGWKFSGILKNETKLNVETNLEEVSQQYVWLMPMDNTEKISTKYIEINNKWKDSVILIKNVLQSISLS